MTSTIKGKIIVLTGVTGGLGSATARAYCEDGAVVIGSDISEAAGAELERELRGVGHDFTFLAGDVSKASTAQLIAAFVAEKHGHLDVLHNMAGVMLGDHVQKMPEDDWDLVINVSVRGSFLMTKYLSPLMGEGGSIINMGSSLGVTANENNSAYCAAKGAIVNFTRATAVDLAPSIRVNAICPGAIDTAMPRSMVAGLPEDEAAKVWRELESVHLLDRIGQPSEIASVAVFLASDASSFMTGSTVMVDGGWTAR